MNKEAMLAVADVIEWTGRFNIGSFTFDAESWSSPTIDEVWEKCTTTACFAGWAAVWADRKPLEDGNGNYFQIGMEEFGLNDRQAEALFMGHGDWIYSDEVLAVTGGQNLWGMSADEQPEHAAALLRAVANGDVTL